MEYVSFFLIRESPGNKNANVDMQKMFPHDTKKMAPFEKEHVDRQCVIVIHI